MTFVYMNISEKKELAKSLYIKSKLNRKQICEMVDCAEKTLRNWIKKYNWDQLREAETITRSELLRSAYKQLQQVNQHIEKELNGIPNKEMSDVKAVIRKEIEALSEMPLYQYIEVAEDFTGWLANNHPKQLKETTSLMYEFIQELATKQGL